LAGEVRTASGKESVMTRVLPTNFAASRPLFFKGRSKSLSSLSFQLDFACLINKRVLLIFSPEKKYGHLGYRNHNITSLVVWSGGRKLLTQKIDYNAKRGSYDLFYL
jgi:hypothetical protein